MQRDMLEVSGEEFRETFDCLFQVKPDLSIDDAYEILKSTGFDVRIALLRLWELVKPVNIHVPSEDAMGRSSQASDNEAMEVDDDEMSESSNSSSHPGVQQSVSGINEVLRNPITVLPTHQDEREQSISSDTYSGVESESDEFPEDVTNLIVRGEMSRSTASSPKFDLLRPCPQCKAIKCTCINMLAKKTSPVYPRREDNELEAKKTKIVDKSAAKNSKHHADTTVTKWIGRLAGGLFLRTLLVCGGKDALQNGIGIATAAGVEDLEGNDEGIAALIDVTCDPELIRRSSWQGNQITERINLIGSPIWKEKSGKIGYASAVVDKTHIKPGDYVAVRPATEKNTAKMGKISDKKVAAGIWFARIVYLFQDGNGNASAHIRYLEHGGETILKETAGPRELFLLSECNDASLGAIAGKIRVDYVGRNDTLDRTGIGAVELDFHEINHYFYRLWYSGTGERFEDASLHQHGTSESGAQACYCCERELSEEAAAGTSVIRRNNGGAIETISYERTCYSIHDFVYIIPEKSDEPYLIGQIMGFTVAGITGYMSSTSSRSDRLKVHAKVQLLERYDDLLPPWLSEADRNKGFHVRDDRRLYYTGRVSKIPEERLDGRCCVQHRIQIDDLNTYKDFEDTFYVIDRVKPGTMKTKDVVLNDLEHLKVEDLRPSSDDDIEFVKEMSMVEDFLSKDKRLRSMEIFAGAGGLTVGLDQSGAIRTEWAVEWNIPAAKTCSHNMPGIKLYNHDANILLQRAVEEYAGTANEVLLDFQGKPIQAMPKPGDVEFLYGGPSCQDFSLCNQYPKANSIKNSLLATYLSYVDHYRPKYFLLENVIGLLQHRLGSTQVNINKTRGGIEMGSVKFILRALTSLGYQAQFGVLQASEHGTPQSRARVFFWGAAPGYPLPKYPKPTHLSSRVSKVQYSRHNRRSVPHRQSTVGAAITDLPSFDYKLKVPNESRADKEARDRRAFKFRQVILDGSNLTRIGRDVDRYASEPLSEYQRKMRQGNQGQEVQDHYTMRWRDDMMVRILRIPMRPGANHLDLPPEQDMWCLRDKNSAAAKHRFYPDRFGRLDFEKPFQTCLTNINPSGKNGTVLHPNQHRILTVREQSRAMGFPDWFTFPKDQEPKESYRQLGNAVACPVGKAIGRELLKVRVKAWWDQEKSTSKKANEISHSIEEDDVWWEID